eukprot:5661885-Amphidinium_carterae.2
MPSADGGHLTHCLLFNRQLSFENFWGGAAGSKLWARTADFTLCSTLPSQAPAAANSYDGTKKYQEAPKQETAHPALLTTSGRAPILGSTTLQLTL